MTKQAMLFDFHNMAFKNFWLEVANKKSSPTQSLPSHELKFLIKKTTKFCIPSYYTGNMLLAVLKKECIENHMKYTSI